MSVKTCQLGALGAAFVLSLAAGCRRDEVTHYRVAKESPAADSAGLMPASMSPMKKKSSFARSDSRAILAVNGPSNDPCTLASGSRQPAG